jgi:hypothetical protein
VHVDYVTITLTTLRRRHLSDEDVTFDVSVRTTADSASRVESSVEKLQVDDDESEALVAALKEEFVVQQIAVPSALTASTGTSEVENDVSAPDFVEASDTTDESTGIATPTTEESGGAGVGAIVGGVVGALVLTAAVAVVVVQRNRVAEVERQHQPEVRTDEEREPHNVNPMYSRESSGVAELE